MLTRSNAREHHFFVERAQCRTVNAAHDIRATCSWQTGPTAHVESVGVIAKVRCQQQFSHRNKVGRVRGLNGWFGGV